MTHIKPLPEQLEAHSELPSDTPIEMLNLLRFRDRAEYPEGHEAAAYNWSGAEAYRQYLGAAGKVIKKLGIDVIWTAGPTLTLIGPTDEGWDLIFVARHPDADTFRAMIEDPDYQAAAVHRTAAIADSRLIRCVPIALQKD